MILKALTKLILGTRIIWYLLSTKDKGLILKPTPDLSFDMFVNADFAGWWHKEYAKLHDSVLSWTGFVICSVVAQSHGAANYKWKLLYLQLRVNTLLFPQQFLTYYPLDWYYKILLNIVSYHFQPLFLTLHSQHLLYSPQRSMKTILLNHSGNHWLKF